MDVKQIRAVVTGRVQGVGFRHFVLRAAERLELVGWVRNTAGGDVELVAQGPPPALEELLTRLRQGPPAAQVLSVAAEYCDPDPPFRDFQVKPTAYGAGDW